MNQMVGYLIRVNRVKKKMSQEQLCKGICAVSYLSKIEMGIAEPNDNIVDSLFSRLGITYTSDSLMINEYNEFFERYFDAFYHQEQSAEIEERIYKNKDRIQASPLSMRYQIFAVYQAESDRKVAIKLLKGIDPYKEYLSDEELFLYYMAKGRLSDTYEGRIRSFDHARQIKDCSLVYEALTFEAFHRENYIEALRYCKIGYERAMDEGFLLVAKQLSFLEGMCYGKVGEIQAMVHAYARTKELFRGDEKIESSINYNIGVTYMDKQQYDEAIPYFLLALKGEQEKETAFAINHRLAMAYEMKGDLKVGSIYLDMADNFARKIGKIQRDMVQMARLRYQGNAEENEEYGELLVKLFSLEDEMGEDFVRFYKPYMVEWLKKNRKYKEALRLIEEDY